MAKNATTFKLIGLLCFALCSIWAMHRFAHPPSTYSPCVAIKALTPSSPSASQIVATGGQITSPRHDEEHNWGALKSFISYFTTKNIVLFIASFALFFGALIILNQYGEESHEAFDERLDVNMTSIEDYNKGTTKLSTISEGDENNCSDLISPYEKLVTYQPAQIQISSCSMPNMRNELDSDRLCPGLLFGQQEDEFSKYNTSSIDRSQKKNKEPHPSNVHYGADPDSDHDDRFSPGLAFTGCRYK